jgi:hypothetical protein
MSGTSSRESHELVLMLVLSTWALLPAIENMIPFFPAGMTSDAAKTLIFEYFEVYPLLTDNSIPPGTWAAE